MGVAIVSFVELLAIEDSMDEKNVPHNKELVGNNTI